MNIIRIQLYSYILITKLNPSNWINIRENRKGNQEWTIQRHWQEWVHKTHDEDKQNKKIQHRKEKLKRWATKTSPKSGGEPDPHELFLKPFNKSPVIRVHPSNYYIWRWKIVLVRQTGVSREKHWPAASH